MDAYQARFATELRNRITARIVEANEQFATAMAEDYPGYLLRVGVVKGLKEALEMAQWIEDALGRPEDKPRTLPTINRGYET